jgi:hypothetical protein
MGGESVNLDLSQKKPDSPFLSKNGESYLVRLDKQRNEALQERFSFKNKPSGMGTSVERTTSEAPKAQKVTPKKVTVSKASSTKTLSCPTCKSGKPVRKTNKGTEYLGSNGNFHYAPDAPERSPEEEKAWLKAFEKALTPFWEKANKELAKVTDEEALREYNANRAKYDAEDPKDPTSKVPPIERARRDIAARRALNGHKFG